MAVKNREMTVKETVKALIPFYIECADFWKRNGTDTEEAVRRALIDVGNLEHDPYSPNGRPLHKDAQYYLVKYFEEECNLFTS